MNIPNNATDGCSGAATPNDRGPVAKRVFPVKAIVFIIAGALIGIFAATIVTSRLQSYSTTVSVRPQSPQQFSEMSLILSDAGSAWLATSLSDRAFDVFLSKLRNTAERKDAIRAALKIPNADEESVNALTAAISSTPAGVMRDKSVTISLPLAPGQNLAEFMDRFVATLIVATAAKLKEDGSKALEILVKGKQRELSRVREQREFVLRQQILLHENALRTANAAGIGNALPTMSPPPLFSFGPIILQSEIENLKSQKGVDLLIPEYPSINSVITDLKSKEAALAQLDLDPIFIVSSSSTAKRISNLTRILAAIMLAVFGGGLGYLCFRISMGLRRGHLIAH